MIQFAEEKQKQLESHRLDTELNNANLKDEALAVLSDFVESCGQLDDDVHSDVLQRHVNQLLQNVSKDNPFIKLLLS